MSNNTAPNLGAIAQDDWESGFDMESLIQQESQDMINAENNKSNNDMPQMRDGGTTDVGLSVKMPDHLKGGSQQPGGASQYQYKPESNQGQYANRTAPAQQTQYQPQTPGTGNAPQVTETDLREKDIQSVLDDVDGNTSINQGLSGQSFKDSGTIVPGQQQQPQQNLNPNSNNNAQQPNNGNNDQNAQDPYILAFQIANTAGALTIPENVDLNKMDQAMFETIVAHTERKHRYDAMNFIRQQASQDADTLKLLEYGMQSVPFANIPKMQKIIQDRRDFTNFNIDTEANQKAIIELYLSDGLDPNDPRNRFVLDDSIPAQIEKLKDEGKLKEKANESKTYFITQSDQAAKAEEERAIAMKEQQRYQEAIERQAQEKYQNDFLTALNSSGWADQVKDAVRKETGIVTLQDGTKMPLWQYKQNVILDNPNLFPVFLDFMTKFNAQTGKFDINAQQEQPADAVAALLKNMNNKQNNNSVTTVGNSQPNDPNAPAQPRVVNVQKSWF